MTNTYTSPKKSLVCDKAFEWSWRRVRNADSFLIEHRGKELRDEYNTRDSLCKYLNSQNKMSTKEN